MGRQTGAAFVRPAAALVLVFVGLLLIASLVAGAVGVRDWLIR